MPVRLAIDTSGDICSVALVSSGAGAQIVRAARPDGAHFESLPTLFAEVCAAAGVAAADITQILVGIGPGSFTGLRIGMSFAKGLSWSLRVPCCGVCSFAAAAAVYLWHNPAIERVCVVGDARRDELFFAAYRREGGIAGVAVAGAQRVCELEAPQIVPRAQLFSSQSWTPGTSVIAIQGGIALPERELQPCGDIAVGILLRESVQDMPFSVGELAALEPRYLRAVAAKTIAERTGAPHMRQAESG